MRKIYNLLLLGAFMLLGTQGLMAAETTVYFVNSGSWAKVYCHHWDGTSPATTWPGDELSSIGKTYAGYDIYSCTWDAGTSGKCIFNNNDGTQTGNLSWIAGAMFVWGNKWQNYVNDDNTLISKFGIYESNDEWLGAELMKANSSDGVATVSLSLAANTTYDFYIRDNANSGFYKNGGTMNSLNCTDWGFGDGGSNAKITTTTAGTYLFSWNLSAHTLSVVYPSYSVAIGSLNYATLCLPVEVSIPSGVEAYYESAYSFNSTTNVVDVTFSALADYIPAGVPVILHSNSAGTYAFAHTSTSAVNPVDLQTDFKGLYSYTSYAGLGLSGETAYVLQDFEDGGDHFFGFHKLNTTGHINASRCYLVVGTTGELHAPSVRMYLPGEVTYIENIEANEDAVKFIQDGKLFIKKNGIVYDMMGTIVK